MKIVMVARRNERRIVRWQGILAFGLVYLAIAAPIFFGGVYWIGRPPPDPAGTLTFFVMPFFWTLGGMLGRLMSMPLHELPHLNDHGWGSAKPGVQSMAKKPDGGLAEL